MCAVSAISYAQTDPETGNRLRRLENEVQTLSRAVFKGETPPPGAFARPEDAANVEVRLGQMESDLRDLTNKLEQQSFEIQQLQQELSRANARAEAASTRPAAGTPMDSPPVYNQAATDELPQPAPLQPQPASTTPATGDGDNGLGTLLKKQQPDGSNYVSVTPGDDPAALYENAFTLLKDSDYAGAERGFSTFLKANPDHALAPNAQYWLGESYYVRNSFQEAARTFAEGYQKFPKSPKAADTLLKLGMSLSGMGSKSDACIAYGQLLKEYPNGPGPALRRAEQEMSSLGCQQ